MPQFSNIQIHFIFVYLCKFSVFYNQPTDIKCD